ncbi:MAG: hypothetical protein ACP5QO_17935 [Clostridia bacterium]
MSNMVPSQQAPPVTKNAAPVSGPSTVSPASRPSALNFTVRVIRYLEGVLLVLLALRFGLAVLAADAANGIVHAVYAITWPFVAPFAGIFSYTVHYAASQFELFTLAAMAIYALIAWGLMKLLTLTQP